MSLVDAVNYEMMRNRVRLGTLCCVVVKEAFYVSKLTFPCLLLLQFKVEESSSVVLVFKKRLV